MVGLSAENLGGDMACTTRGMTERVEDEMPPAESESVVAVITDASTMGGRGVEVKTGEAENAKQECQANKVGH